MKMYRYCKIKNIGVPATGNEYMSREFKKANPHLDLVAVLPNDCIRLSINVGADWCGFACNDCFGA